MHIPDSCHQWRLKMQSNSQESDGAERQVLHNVEADPCTPLEVEEEFFVRLARTSPWENAPQAWEAAIRIVWGNDRNPDGPDRFYCVGRIVPEDRMRTLIRFTPVADWSRNLDKEAPQRASGIAQRTGVLQSSSLAAVGGSAAKLWPADLSPKQRAALCSDLAQEYPTGHSGGIAWVADAADVPWQDDRLRPVLRRLGLPHFEHDIWVLMLRYNRNDLNRTLHVPRAFDGINCPGFAVQTDCDAPTGMTRPTPEAGEGSLGYPEAVHRNRMMKISVIALRQIDGHTS